MATRLGFRQRGLLIMVTSAYVGTEFMWLTRMLMHDLHTRPWLAPMVQDLPIHQRSDSDNVRDET